MEQISTLQPMLQPMFEQSPDRNSSPWREAHAGADFLVGTAAHGGPTLEQSFPEGLQRMENIHAAAGEKCEEEGEVESNSCVNILCEPKHVGT